jgi:flagellin-like hook-associated protein FlgL
MLPIGANGGAISRQTQQVQRAFDQLSNTSIKLATLTKINRGSDDPAGMIAAEQLKQELTSLDAASRASERYRSFVHVADSGLAQAGELLKELEGNLVAAANEALSPAERDAIQIEIDAAVDALDRIGVSTRLGGERVFDGQSRDSLVGPNPGDQATLDVPELSSGALGSDQGTLAELRGSATDDVETALDIVHGARSQVLNARAELGVFERNSIDSTSKLFDDAAVNLSAALSEITDTDVALETSNLARSMILSDTAVATARLAVATHNAQASLLDELLRFERAS